MSVAEIYKQSAYEPRGFRTEIADPRVDERRAAVVAAIAPHQRRFVADLVTLSVHEIGPLETHDGVLLGLLEASIEENVVTVLHMLEHGLEPAALDAPAAAIVYARRLAQRDIPLSALLRAYRLGQESFLSLVLEEALRQGDNDETTGATMISLVRLVAAYIDAVCEQVARTYEQERERWVSRRGALQSRRVQELLQGSAPVDVGELEAALGYRLDQTHVAVDAWVDPSAGTGDELLFLERVARTLSKAMGATGQPLVVPSDEREAWFWVPVPAGATLDADGLTQAIRDIDVPVRMAVGAAGTGINGFRRSHRQAQQVKSLVLMADERCGPVTTFPAVGPLALMSADLDGLRAWVGDVLGPLAVANERNSWLRETLRVFLKGNGSYAAAAEVLQLHRNTVQYRVQQAESTRGAPILEDRFELQLALIACRWLGDAVLQPVGAEG